MPTAPLVKTGFLGVNGAELYYEIRGSGPPLLSVALGGGDAGAVAPVADLLADCSTVVSYDRRGCSRSPRPDGWTATSIEEQADDAASVIEALGLGATAVFGTSTGGAIALDLAIRRPELVRVAVVHEPVVPTPASAADVVGALDKLLAAVAGSGPARMMELLSRLYQTDPELRARLLANAATFFEIEVPAITAYFLDERALTACRVPIVPVVSRETRAIPWFGRTTGWIAACIGAEEREVPGEHASPWTHPKATADLVRRAMAGRG